MYDLNGNMLKIFDSCTEAAIEMFKDKNKRNGICKCASGETKTSYGYIWRYYEDVLDDDNRVKNNLEHDDVVKLNTRNKTDINNIPVYKFDLNGKYICMYDSIKDASVDTNIGYNSIRACLTGKQNVAGGFRWKIADGNQNIAIKENKNKKMVCQFDLSWNYIGSYESVTKASEITGIGVASIQKCASGKNKTAGGYYWAYYDEIGGDISGYCG